MVRLFISHSELDKALVKPMYEWLRCGLGLDSDDIRCTSMENTPPGERSEDVLRRDLQSSEAVVGFITPNSLASRWVGLELGAAWLNERLHPVLGPGVQVSDLPSPLPTITNVSYCEVSRMDHLLQNLAGILDCKTTGSAKTELDEMINAGQQFLLQGKKMRSEQIAHWFSLAPVVAAWRTDETKFDYTLSSLCKKLDLDVKEMRDCTQGSGYIIRDPESLPSWAADHWKLSRMAVNQLLASDQDLVALPRDTLDEQLMTDLKRALRKRTLKRGILLNSWFDRAHRWVADRPQPD